MAICVCGSFLYCQHRNGDRCIYLDTPDEPDDDMTIEQMNREESRYIDMQNARDINRKIS